MTLFTRYIEMMDYLQQGICEGIPDQTHSWNWWQQCQVLLASQYCFDASSHEDGCPSLNDCLLMGPNLNPDLLTILVRFRLHPIRFMPDITKANIHCWQWQRCLAVPVAHRTPDAEDTKSCTLRMACVVFGVSSSPFLLAATIRNHLEKYQKSHPQPSDTLKLPVCWWLYCQLKWCWGVLMH